MAAIDRADSVAVVAGKLRRVELIPAQSIENSIRTFNIVPEDQVADAASFIRACLRLDSYDRPTANDLEKHPWIVSADCSHHH